MDVQEYLKLEQDGIRYNIGDALDFLKMFDPTSISQMEIEMCIMHVAGIVSSSNIFVDNYNVRSDARDAFIDHVSMILDSDCASWSRKLADKSFWNDGNIPIANLILNWINGSLDNPVRFS
jgi:hypothetical protein